MKEDLTEKYKSNIWKTFVLYVLASLTMFAGIIQIFYFQHFGLSYFQIASITSMLMITILIFEVPTGAFADVYGRKRSINLGLLGFFIGSFVLAFSSTYSMFLIGSVVWGIGQAFMSGAWQALLYNSLKKIGKKKEYLKIISRQEATFLIFMLISTLLGPYLFEINVRYPLYVSCIFASMLFLFSFTLFEPKLKSKKFSIKKHFVQMQEGFKYLKGKYKIIWLIAFGTLLSLVLHVGRQLTGAPFVLEKGFSVLQYGYIAFFSVLIQAGLMTITHKIENKLKEKDSFIMVFMVWILTYFIAYFMFGIIFIIASSLSGGLLSMVLILIDSVFNHNIKESIRATVLSIFSMIASLIGALALVAIGLLIDTTTLYFALFVLGTLSLVLGSILLKIRYNNKIWKRINSK